MPLSFQEMMRPEVSSDAEAADAASQHQLVERLKSLRNSGRLPNARVCQVVGSKVCLRSCDPFGLDEAGAEELAQLGLRSIIDLRSDHERNEAADAPLYRHLRVLQWQPSGGLGFVDASTSEPVDLDNLAAAEADAAPIAAFRIDCLRSPQPQLRRFLADYSGPCRLCVPDVSAFLLPACDARPAARLLRDVLDCFPGAVAATFRVLALPGAYPVLLASSDGQQVAAAVCCLLLLLLGEDASIVADMHAASETEYGRARGLFAPEEQGAKLKESRLTMLQLIDYIVQNYHSAENYLLRAGLSQREIRQLKTV